MRGGWLRRARVEAGQSLVEFAVAMPVVLVIVIGALDFGRVVWTNEVLANAAREGARYAIAHGGSPSTRCPAGPPAPGATAASGSCQYPSPSKQGIVVAAEAQLFSPGGPVTVAVCYGTGCSGNADSPGATNVRGTPVTVTTSSTVQLVAGALIGMANVSLVHRSTMVVNH